MEFRKADLGLLNEAVTKGPSPLDNSRRQREAERPHEVEIREREEQANVRVRAALMFGEMMVMEEREKRLRAEGMADALDRLAIGKLDETRKGVGFLVNDRKSAIRRHAKAAKATPRGSYDDEMTDAQWSKFLTGLEKKLVANQKLPKSKRENQLTIIETAIELHNGTCETKITISADGVKKKLQRWRHRKK